MNDELADTPDAHAQAGPTAREREQLFVARHFKALMTWLTLAFVALCVWFFVGNQEDKDARGKEGAPR